MTAFINVVRAELFKASRKRRTYVLAGLHWLILPTLALVLGRVLQVNLGGTFVDENATVERIVQLIASPYGVARIALLGPALLSPTFYIIVVALFSALLVGEERSHNMWKTTLVAQPSRLAVLAGKYVVAMILLALLLAGAYLSGTAFGALGTLFLDTDFAGEWGRLAALYGLQWLYLGAAVAFAFLMIFLVRNISLGIVMVFFLPALIEGLYTVYRTLIGFQPVNRLNAFFQALRIRETLEELPRYFFTNNLYAPSREPLAAIVRTLGGDPTSDLGPLTSLLRSDITLAHAGMVMAGYAAIFGAFLVLLFLRRDVD